MPVSPSPVSARARHNDSGLNIRSSAAPLHYSSEGCTGSLLPLDVPAYLTLAYLAVPIFCFLLGWLIPVAGIFLSMVLLVALVRLLKAAPPAIRPTPDTWTILLAVAVAVAWSIFGGAGHFFYANAHDWIIRDAVLRDLAQTRWPPAYNLDDGVQAVLRTAVAYYLPAAAMSKLIGTAYADRLLWLWTVIGLALFLGLMAPYRGSRGRQILAMGILVAFSGMDILGLMFPDYSLGNLPLPWAFIDWWLTAPPLISYWSNTAQLFWAPNHALAAWLPIALFFRHWRNPQFGRVIPLLIAVLPLWSPFALIGMGPFFVLAILKHVRTQGRKSIDPMAFGLAFILLGASALYLGVGVSAIHIGLTATTAPEWYQFDYLINPEHLWTFAENYFLFVIFEFAILAIIIRRFVEKSLFLISLAMLLVFPFISFGPGNDLGMRASIPPLMVMCWGVLSFIAHGDVLVHWRRLVLLTIVVAVGAVTPLYEFRRALIRPSWQPNQDFTLIDASNGRFPPNYLADIRHTLLSGLLQAPTVVPSFIDWYRYCRHSHPLNSRNSSGVPFAKKSNRNEEFVRRKTKEMQAAILDPDNNSYTARPRNGIERIR